MKQITDLILNATGLGSDTQMKIISSLIVILGLWLARFLIVNIMWRRIEDVRNRYIAQKAVTYTVVLFGIIMIGRIWFEGFASLATFLGLLSAGLIIALKDLVTNIAGWIFLMLRRPFTMGDRIQIGEHAGDVIDIRLFQFTIMEIGNWVQADQSTGRVVHIPNGKLFAETLANYSKGFHYIWNEIRVLITFESNWERAKKMMQEIANQHSEHLSDLAEKRVREASKKFMIYFQKLTPIVYTSVRDSGVLLTIRYLCEPRHRRNTEEVIWEEILTEFARCDDIDFAYPTQRFYDNRTEGKRERKSSSEE
jgi:small-conductance mechanosensitive channel